MPENSSENVFVVFFSPQLILQFYRGFPMVISKKTIIFQGLRGVQHFPGAAKLSQGVSSCRERIELIEAI